MPSSRHGSSITLSQDTPVLVQTSQGQNLETTKPKSSQGQSRDQRVGCLRYGDKSVSPKHPEILRTIPQTILQGKRATSILLPHLTAFEHCARCCAHCKSCSCQSQMVAKASGSCMAPCEHTLA